MPKKDQDILRPEEEAVMRAAAEPEAVEVKLSGRAGDEAKLDERARRHYEDAAARMNKAAARIEATNRYVLMRNRAVAREAGAGVIEQTVDRVERFAEAKNPNLEADVEQVRRGLAPLLDPGNPLSREEREAQAVEHL